MNSEHVQLIRSKLTELSDCTTNFNDLVRHLVQTNTITISDMEVLTAVVSSRARFTDLYVLLFRKGPKAFENLLEALRNSDNDAAYELLTSQRNDPGPVGSSNTPRAVSQPQPEFAVDIQHIGPICDILESSSTLSSNWNTIRREMISSGDINALEGQEATREYPFYEILVNTLQKWVEVHGRQASFESLLRALNSRRETRTVERLREALPEIQQIRRN